MLSWKARITGVAILQSRVWRECIRLSTKIYGEYHIQSSSELITGVNRMIVVQAGRGW